jgi:hypothetical protein
MADPAARQAALVRSLEGQPFTVWVERIVNLRRDGRHDDADALVAVFRRRFPDVELPAAAGREP